MNQNEIKVFNCDLNDTNLYSCILEELNEEDINLLTTHDPIINSKTIINCLNASLVNCLRINRQELDFPKVQLHIMKKESGDWLVNQINIIVDKLFDDAIVYERINQCLKFVKTACKMNDSFQLSIIQSEIKEDLKYYKIKLAEIEQLFQEIRDDKSKKENLFSLFKNLSSK
ncbi:MAG: hypothetical protein ACFE9Q_06185 [Candidatus Hodarchaeota archaeon]